MSHIHKCKKYINIYIYIYINSYFNKGVKINDFKLLSRKRESV